MFKPGDAIMEETKKENTSMDSEAYDFSQNEEEEDPDEALFK